MASEATKNLNLTVYSGISGVYQRELRQAYAENFKKIDEGYEALKTSLEGYVDKKLGEIENGTY